MKIAIRWRRQAVPAFGHCEQFVVLTVDPGNGTVMGRNC